MKEKVYTFTTTDAKGNEIFKYRVADTHVRFVREYAKKIVGNSSFSEIKHGIIRIDFDQNLPKGGSSREDA
jgi:hypothetical protein